MSDTPEPVLDFFLHLELPPLLLALLIGLPSCALYLGQVLLVWLHAKEFDSSFFKLFMARAMPSVWNMAASYLSFRLPMLAPQLFLPLYLKMPQFLLQTAFFSSYYTFQVENLSTLFLILNRLSSILLPFRHNKIWHFGLPLAIGLTFLGPLAINYSIFTLDLEVQFMDGSNTSFSFVTPQQEFPYSRAASLSAILFTLLCTLLNIGTIVAYRRQARIVGHGQGSGQAGGEDKMEAKLTKYAAITFLCQLCMGSFFLSLFISQNIGSDRALLVGLAIFNFYGLINDICTLAIPAWSMLWASSKMRRIFRCKFRKAKRIFLDNRLFHRNIVDVQNGGGNGNGTPQAMVPMATVNVRSRSASSQNLHLHT